MSKAKTRGRPDEDSVKKSITLRRATVVRVSAYASEHGLTFSRACDELLVRQFYGDQRHQRPPELV